ncbi:PIR Superfamily Protein [Plasmodium ovale wallikeri]|uniref:PIR Superfamily Protein n=1 Tax=Plasmodium ovale wallikeri TaxID=864142 RepID=A0A1A9AGD0_PLAOA|nr:PIR Superfamily Protein [Plasmodium ovale wallikeri]SBT58850.1 PIR Superfamily Protein [Plasmodium ovale wallikeri]
MSGANVVTLLKSLMEKYTFQKKPDIQKFHNELGNPCANDFFSSCNAITSGKEPCTEHVKFYHKLNDNITGYTLVDDEFNTLKEEPPNSQIYHSILDDIKKLKLSLDYIEIYNQKQNTSRINKVLCNSIYKDYMNEVIGICKSKSGDIYEKSQFLCSELYEFKKMHSTEHLSEVACDDEAPSDEESL